MVGAGGIGCELLKNLVLLGLSEIHLVSSNPVQAIFGLTFQVDLDTIDLSNLNRQFLFRHKHIKQPKATIAAETASKFNPNVKLVPHFANIKDTKLFPLSWFQSFDIVYNALDNKDARSYVNQMCLTANVPLIESGTSGFRGQTQAIYGGVTECYECNPKEAPKSFAVCTIRSTPSQPIHCIVWAKSYLFSQLYDEDQQEDAPLDDAETEENSEELKNLQKETNELKSIRASIGTPEFAANFFDKCYSGDIERLASIDTMWKSRKAPIPMSFTDLKEQVLKEGDVKSVAAAALKKDQAIWTVPETFAVLLDSTERLQARYSSGAVLSFDKDDEDTLDFVAAAAILRSQIFSIELKSKFEIKQMAGNIIPAIATTNAIIAGLSVLQSIKVLTGLKDGNVKEAVAQVPTVFISREPTHAFSIERSRGPHPECVACSVTRAILPIDPAVTTLRHLVETLLQKNWGYSDEFSIVTSGLIYDPDFDDNLDRTLADLKVETESFLTVMDESDEDGHPLSNLELYITRSDTVNEKEEDQEQNEKVDVDVEGKKELTALDVEKILSELPKPEFSKKFIPATAADDDDGDESDIELMTGDGDGPDNNSTPGTTKRKLEPSSDELSTPVKKAKTDAEEVADVGTAVIELLDDDDEVIEID